MKDYRITVKVRNNRLLRAIETVGVPGGKWCEQNGLCYNSVNNLVNMVSGPLTKSGELTITASKLCDVLGKLPEDLWSNEQLYPLEKNFSEMDMDFAQVMALLPTEHQSYLPDFSALEAEETRNLVQKARSILSARENEAIDLRFSEDMTHDQCASRMGISRERVRQIEARAMRKLRSLAFKGKLRDAL